MMNMASYDTNLINQITFVLKSSGTLTSDAGNALAVEWIDAGFDDPDEVQEWLSAGCFAPEHTRRLDDAGITPEQAALVTTAGLSSRADTVGHKVSTGEMSLEEARRIITSHFWND
jgi:hypothetical protein